MFNLSNSLSLLRAPLALLFLAENVTLRITAIVLAMCTDALDGYLARRLRATSHIGTILDPAMDKFFVFFGLGVLIMEGKLEVWQACTMISRDFALCIFGLYLALSGKWQAHEFKAIRWGKATTMLQFFVLIALTLGFKMPWPIFPLFILFGLLALFELLQIRKTPSNIV